MRYLPDSLVQSKNEPGPSLRAWVAGLLGGALPMGGSISREFDGVGTVIALVELHSEYGDGRPRGKVPHRSIGLYYPDAGPSSTADEAPHAPLLDLPIGIDVSGWSPDAPWEAIRDDGISFAFVKTTEGATERNRFLAEQWAGCDRAGVVQGAYHFFRSSTSSPEAQVEHAMAVAESLSPPELGWAVDVESQSSRQDATREQQLGHVSGAVFGERLLRFCELATAAGLDLRWLYTSSGFAALLVAEHLAELHARGLGLWQAAYGRTTPPKPIAPWPAWHLWQYTATGSLRGYPAAKDAIDLNRSALPLPELLLVGRSADALEAEEEREERVTPSGRRIDLYDTSRS